MNTKGHFHIIGLLVVLCIIYFLFALYRALDKQDIQEFKDSISEETSQVSDVFRKPMNKQDDDFYSEPNYNDKTKRKHRDRSNIESVDDRLQEIKGRLEAE